MDSRGGSLQRRSRDHPGARRRPAGLPLPVTILPRYYPALACPTWVHPPTPGYTTAPGVMCTAPLLVDEQQHRLWARVFRAILQKVTKVVILGYSCHASSSRITGKPRGAQGRTDRRLDRHRASTPLINLEVECHGGSLGSRRAITRD